MPTAVRRAPPDTAVVLIGPVGGQFVIMIVAVQQPAELKLLVVVGAGDRGGAHL